MKKQMIVVLTLVAFGAILFADAPVWEVDVPAYEFNATQTGVVTFDGVESVDETDIIATFVDDVCRGVASPSFFPVTGRYTVNMMIYANSNGETMTFKAYDSSADVVFEELFDIDGNVYTYTFLANENVGNDMTPVEWFAVTPVEAITAEFSADVTEGAEAPLTVTFTDLSVVNEGEITSWTWDFGDGETSVEQNPIHEFVTAGYFTVALTVSDGVNEDTETKIDYIHINEAPVLTDIADQTINEDEFIQIILEATDDGGNLVFGATSDEVNITVSVNNDHMLLTPAENWFGEALVTVTVADNFGATDTDDFTLTVVSVLDAPVADFDADVTSGIGSLEVQFTDLSTDVDDAIVAWDWNFGDDATSTDQNPIHLYEMAGNYTVTLTVTDEAGLTGTEEKVDYIVIVPPEELFPPRNLNAEVVDINDVNLTWSAPNSGGEGDEIEEGFEAAFPPEGWLDIDNNGDGYSWQAYEYDPHSGTYAAGSSSWPDQNPVTPDNWLITPALALGGAEELTFWTATQDPAYPAEHYSVKLSTTGTNVSDFTNVLFEETLADDIWHEITVDLSAFAGETVYIAFQHHDCYDMFWMKLDDISVLNRNTREVVFSADFEDVSDFAKMTQRSSGSTKYSTTNREFLGEYNVYRDGVQLNVDPITETNFEEYDLEVGTYAYTVTALYTGGYESDPTEPAEAIILGTGTITGTVTDALDGVAIEGALITAGEFEVLTDTEGSFVLEVIEGTYDVTCSAGGYADQTETITIAYMDVITLDFSMDEVPYAPTVVEAVVNEDDTEATITWSMNAEPVGECAGSYSVVGIADLDEDGVDDPCWSDGTGYFYFTWEGGCLATFIEYSAGGTDLSSYGFTEGFFFYGFEPGVTETFAMTFDTGDVATGTATSACGGRDGLTPGELITDIKYRRYNHFEDASYISHSDYVYETPNLRTLDGYNVYLLLEDDETNEANWVTIAESVVDTFYVDATWADVESGIYEYAVKAVYSSGTHSDPTFSDVLPKDMTVEVTVNVILNSEESPAGAQVTLYGDEFDYTETAGADGVVFPEVWKGNYDLLVELSGYTEYEQSNIDIQDATTLDAVLTEIIEAPENLVVSVDAPNVELSWDEAGQTTILTIEILTDDYGYETTWDLVDSNGNVIDSEMNGDFANATLYTWEYELELGTYVWTIYDEWGDGICCDYGEGYYNLYLNGDNFASGGVFGASESIEFDTDGGSTPDGYFDCDGVEFDDAYLAWLGDGYCDDGTYGVNFLCDDWGWDCGDCEGQTGPDPNGWCDGREFANDMPAKDSFVPVFRSLEGYVIYVDGLEVDIATETSYTWVATVGGTYDFCVSALYTTGESSIICEEGVEVPFGDVSDLHPIAFDLHQNYPNPFNPVTSIGYDIPEACEVQISIYNVLGQQVKTLVNDSHQPGYYSVQWDGTNGAGNILPNGLYIYTIDAGNFSSVKKLVLMK